MQTEKRPQATGPRDLDMWLKSASTFAIYQVAPDAKARQADEDVERFGPMPGEVYPDEAHFGSFS